MKKEAQAIERLCDSKSKVSSHYFIKNNGKVLNLIPDLYTAWHAGKSNWKKLKSLNNYSIGIDSAIRDFSLTFFYYYFNANSSSDLDDDGLVFSISRKTSF